MKSSNVKRFYSVARKLIIVVILRSSYRMKGTNCKTKHLLTFLIRNRSCSRNFICLRCKTKVYYIVDVKIGNGKSVSRRMNKEDQKKECRHRVFRETSAATLMLVCASPVCWYALQCLYTKPCTQGFRYGYICVHTSMRLSRWRRCSLIRLKSRERAEETWNEGIFQGHENLRL